MGKLQIGEHSCSSWLCVPITDTLLWSNHGRSSFHPKTTGMEGWKWKRAHVGSRRCSNARRAEQLFQVDAASSSSPQTRSCSVLFHFNAVKPGGTLSALLFLLNTTAFFVSLWRSGCRIHQRSFKFGCGCWAGYKSYHLFMILLLLQTVRKRWLVFCSLYRSVFTLLSTTLDPITVSELWMLTNQP